MSGETRVDALTGTPVIMATHRQDRPNLPVTGCPFCVGGLEAPEPYDVRWFPNRWPSLGDGRAEVVLFSPDHDASLGGLGPAGVRRVVDLWAERTAALGARDDVAYVLVFENRGAEVGATIPHPHGQIYAFGEVPPVPARELARAEARGGCALATKTPASGWSPRTAAGGPGCRRRRATPTGWSSRPSAHLARSSTSTTRPRRVGRSSSSTSWPDSTGSSTRRCRTCSGSTSGPPTAGRGRTPTCTLEVVPLRRAPGRQPLRGRRRARQRLSSSTRSTPSTRPARCARRLNPGARTMTEPDRRVRRPGRPGASTSSATTPTTRAGSCLPMAIDLGTHRRPGTHGGDRVRLRSAVDDRTADLPLDVVGRHADAGVGPLRRRRCRRGAARRRASRAPSPRRSRSAPACRRARRSRWRSPSRSASTGSLARAGAGCASGPSSGRRACRAGSWTSSRRCSGVEGHALLIDCHDARRRAGAVAPTALDRRRAQPRRVAARSPARPTPNGGPRARPPRRSIGPLRDADARRPRRARRPASRRRARHVITENERVHDASPRRCARADWPPSARPCAPATQPARRLRGVDADARRAGRRPAPRPPACTAPG